MHTMLLSPPVGTSRSRSETRMRDYAHISPNVFLDGAQGTFRGQSPNVELDPIESTVTSTPLVSPRQATWGESLEGLTGAQIFHKMMVRHSVKYIFGLPGGAVLPCFDAIHEAKEHQLILVKHEQNAGHMAEGFARVTGKPGIVLVTSGPRATNMTTALQDAKGDGTPIIVFSGQVPTTALGTDAFQEANIVQITKPCTKWSVMVESVVELPAIIEQAFKVATSGRPGPVLVDLPKDVTQSILRKPAKGTATPKPKHTIPNVIAKPVSEKALRESLQRVAELIRISKRPVVYAGQGVLGHPYGSRLLKRFSDKAQIPVTTTMQGLGSFDEEDPKALHMLGQHGSVYANLAMQEADLIIALGARFDDRAICEPKRLGLQAQAAAAEGRGGIVQFEILDAQINKAVKAVEVIEGEVTSNLARLLPMISQVAERKDWLAQIDCWKKEFPLYREPDSEQGPDGVIDPQLFMRRLSEMTESQKDKTIVSTGVGQHQMWAAQHFCWRFPRTWVSSGSMGTMGYGLPAAIGAKLARPECLVIDIDGDGSFNMSLTELTTAVQYNAAVKIILFNNEEHGMVTQLQSLFYEGRYSGSHPRNPDFCKLADAMGVSARRCSRTVDIDKDLRWLLAECHPGPVLLEVVISPKELVTPMVAAGKGLHEMMYMKGQRS